VDVMKKTFPLICAVLAAVLASVPAHAVVLFSNGPVVDGAGLSIVNQPATTLGWGMQRFFGNRVAEDFTVPAGSIWTVTDINLYAYQTNATAFTFQNVAWSLIAGTDINAGSVVASGINDVTNGGLMGYRSTAALVGNTTRAIYDVKADIADVVLGAGTYWLSWSMATPDPFSGPLQPTTSDFRLGNVKQGSSGTFFTPTDPGSGLTYAAPFQLNGTVSAVPELPSLAAMAFGLMALGGLMRARRSGAQ
jgi:hypothetical protein